MSEHLPECWVAASPDSRKADCICDRLRACEARVREVYESSDDYMLGIAVGRHDGWLEGHAAALAAARDVVAALPETRLNPLVPVIGKVDALAAIDALKEDK